MPRYCIAKTTGNPSKPIKFETTETQDEWDGKWNKPVMYYSIANDCKYLSKQQIQKAFNYAMTTWEIEIPVDFHPCPVGVTPDITLSFSEQQDDSLFSKRTGVLAYAYYPAQGAVSGKMVFNLHYIWDLLGKGITAKEAFDKGWITGYSHPNSVIMTYSIVAVLIHELGHSLGLTHDVSGNDSGTDVMDAYYSGIDRLELSDRDLYRIHLKYGARIYSKWNGYARLKFAIKRAKLRL